MSRKKHEKHVSDDTLYDADISFTERDISKAQEERSARRSEETARNEARREQRKRINRNRRIVMAVLFVLLLTIVGLLGKNIKGYVELTNQKAAAEEKLEALQNEKGALEEELEQVNSDEYVEQQARSELKMIRPGETLYLLNDEDE